MTDEAVPPEHLKKWAADRGLTVRRTVSASRVRWTIVGSPSSHCVRQPLHGQLELFLDVDRSFSRRHYKRSLENRESQDHRKEVNESEGVEIK
jgi:hypothetical protein